MSKIEVKKIFPLWPLVEMVTCGLKHFCCSETWVATGLSDFWVPVWAPYTSDERSEGCNGKVYYSRSQHTIQNVFRMSRYTVMGVRMFLTSQCYHCVPTCLQDDMWGGDTQLNQCDPSCGSLGVSVVKFREFWTEKNGNIWKTTFRWFWAYLKSK